MTTITDATNAIRRGNLRQFINPSQLETIGNLCRGEEGEWFKAKLVSLANLIEAMPETYAQDGKGDQAKIHLHYFTGGCDWYITEKDINADDGEGLIGHYQAFGVANLGFGPEMGYISLPEILAAGAELDLHWTICTLAEVDKARVA
ncbi:MAG: hypothetical protein NTZ28_06680 [Nitrospirae bacterium]|nr:hypothetical protein [Nitrospirota bacterium]